MLIGNKKETPVEIRLYFLGPPLGILVRVGVVTMVGWVGWGGWVGWEGSS